MVIRRLLVREVVIWLLIRERVMLLLEPLNLRLNRNVEVCLVETRRVRFVGAVIDEMGIPADRTDERGSVDVRGAWNHRVLARAWVRGALAECRRARLGVMRAAAPLAHQRIAHLIRSILRIAVTVQMPSPAGQARTADVPVGVGVAVFGLSFVGVLVADVGGVALFAAVCALVQVVGLLGSAVDGEMAGSAAVGAGDDTIYHLAYLAIGILLGCVAVLG